MQFYNATTQDAICQLTDRLCDSNDTSYPRLAKTAEANAARDRVINKIITADGRWQFDDSNFTDMPTGNIALVASQKKYTFNDKFLVFESAQVMDASGKFYFLKPIDQSDYDTPLDELFSTDGLPLYYDKLTDDTIKIYPGPLASLVTLSSIADGKETAGMKVTFKRKGKPFTAVATTDADSTEPGFACNHEILAYMMSIPYCLKYKRNRVAGYKEEIKEMMEEIINIYSNRDKDERKVMTTKAILFR